MASSPTIDREPLDTWPTAWIFDLDGTLTVAVHDFEAMRVRLGVEPGVGLLEAMACMDRSRREEAERIIAEWEVELAERATAAPGALSLLQTLRRRGVHVGILTRNTASTAWRTLVAAGLDSYFDPACVLGRDSATPKPSPAGVLRLLERWKTSGSEAVMLGDHITDVQAGQRAGALGVLVRDGAPSAWRTEADRWAPDLVVLGHWVDAN